MLNFLGIRHKESGSEKLNSAINNNDMKQLQILLDQGISPNTHTKRGPLPLKLAIDKTNVDAVKILLENGADPNISAKIISVLNFAITKKNMEIIRSLLDYGADINSSSGHLGTPLNTAITVNSPEVVTELLVRGADINKSVNNYTYLMNAIEWGRVEIAKILIENGVDIYAGDHGLNAYKMSIAQHQPEITKMIIKKDLENKIFHLKLTNTYFSVIPRDLLGLIINS